MLCPVVPTHLCTSFAAPFSCVSVALLFESLEVPKSKVELQNTVPTLASMQNSSRSAVQAGAGL